MKKAGCFQWFKDTKMKANHNVMLLIIVVLMVVSSGSKILKWKQITTHWFYFIEEYSCFQWFKDTKMKANHNYRILLLFLLHVVSSGSKILKWKQITTEPAQRATKNSCFQWFKDTKMKANHNHLPAVRASSLLFPVVQRY